MGEKAHKRFELSEKSYSSLIKMKIREIASELNLSKTRAAEIDLIVSEIITNLIKHATNGGEILARIISSEDYKGLEIIGLDSGPGIKDLKRMTLDGVSSTNTLGHGLGTIKRLSDEYDIYSLAGWGTVVLSRVWEKKHIVKNKKLETAAVMIAKEGEEECGDGWVSIESKQKLKVGIFDGLGHGSHAHSAAEAAIDSFKKNVALPPEQLLNKIHNDIKNTRGAVGFIIEIDKIKMSCKYSGIGNIAGKSVSRQSTQNLFSYNGTVGHVIPAKMSDHYLDLSLVELLIVHSDGLKSKWELEKHPSFFNHHPATIAAIIYNQKARGNDDVTVAVIKKNRKINNKS